MKRQEIILPILLLVYHLIFAVVAWQYYSQNAGDAHRYWILTGDWNSYLNVGTDVIKLINYPFAKILHLPFWAGFVLHSLMSFYAIYELYSFSLDYIKPTNNCSKYLLMFVFLLPNLHFWTSIIGKEPIVFLAITLIMINQFRARYFNFQYIFSWILLILIRPHVAMFLLLAISFALIIKDKKLSGKKILVVISTIILALGLYLMTMHLLDRNPLHIAYILERNDASLVAFQRADSYVPMIDYNVFERFFVLNFRPLFIDSVSLYSFILSAENFLTLIVLFFSLLIFIYRFKTIKLDFFAKVALLFFIISSLFFIQRYSCLGIFVRTKIMYLPFVMIVAVKIIEDSKIFSNRN